MENNDLSILAEQLVHELPDPDSAAKPAPEQGRDEGTSSFPQMDVLMTKLDQTVVYARQVFRKADQSAYQMSMKRNAERIYGITLVPYMDYGLCLTLPVLVANKRKQSIIREPLIAILSDTKLKSYIGQKIRLPMQDAVIIFVHRFSAVDTVNFRVRDFDNYDVQDILNCLVYEGYLKSDSGSCLDGMDIAKTGCSSTGTTAYLIPKSRLCEWVRDHYS